MIVIALSMQTGSALAVSVIGDLGIVEALWLRTAVAAAILVAVRPRSLRLPEAGHRLPVAGLALALLGHEPELLRRHQSCAGRPRGRRRVHGTARRRRARHAASRRCRVDRRWPARACCCSPARQLHERPRSRAVAGRGRRLGRLPAARQAGRDGPRPAGRHDAHAGRARPRSSTPCSWSPASSCAATATRSRSALVVAVLSSALPYFIELVALRRVRASTYGVLLSVEPAIAALAGCVVLAAAARGEWPPWARSWRPPRARAGRRARRAAPTCRRSEARRLKPAAESSAP